MGWDTYCCICGNSCKGGDSDYLKELFDFPIKNKLSLTEVEQNKIIKDIAKKIKWFNKGMTLFTNNKNKKLNDSNCEQHLPFKDNYESGIFIHCDCWKFVKITYGIDLHYSNLPVNYKDISKQIPPLMNINYGEIKKYWKQDMDFYKIVLDKNTYMLDSPLVSSNTNNINRIKNIIGQLKLKKELRPSPPISATFYKNNTIKIGNNNNFWIIKNNKWNEIKENVIKKKYIFDYKNKLIYKILDLPQIAEYNNIPLFIYNIKEIPSIKYNIQLIGTDKTLLEFEKKYVK